MDLSLDILLQETLALTEYLRSSNNQIAPVIVPDASIESKDDDYLYDLADSLVAETTEEDFSNLSSFVEERVLPETPGILYKIDNGGSTFCVRGFSVNNIKNAYRELAELSSAKRVILKLDINSNLEDVSFFEAKTYELAEAVRDQIINRRFPHQEDALCNLSDPGFSWWMNIDQNIEQASSDGRFEIFFRSHGINRAEKYIQLGPIGDGGIAALRMNQARTLLRSSFPISEFSCDDKSFTVASLKPDHLSFVSFKNIFLHGENHTELENFPDNSVGRTLFYYFHELAIVRKFWIEVKSKLG